MADTEVAEVDNGGNDVTAKPVEESVEPAIQSETSENTETIVKSPVKSTEPPNELEKKIIQQVEYYFGDANLARDKFLSEYILGDEGYVPLELLLTFKMLSAMTEAEDVLVAALDKSESGLLQLSADRKKVRRHPDRPLRENSEETRKECIARTAYVKGFPSDTLMAHLIPYFNNYNKVINIVMRKYLDKPTKEYKFKGSVFISFETREQCEEFLKNEEVEYKGVKLEKKWQELYYSSKRDERDAMKQKKNDDKPGPKITLPTGAVIFFEGYSETVTREIIKEAVSKLGSDVAYIDYTKGDKSGYIRLTEENAAKGLLEKLEGSKLKIDENEEATVRLIEGDEEKEYLAKQVQQMISRPPRRSNFHNRNKGGGNRFSNRKRRGGSPDCATDAKRKNIT